MCWPSLVVFALLGLQIEQLAASMLKWERRKQLEDEKKERAHIDQRCLMRKRATEWLVFVLNVLNASLTMWVPFHVMTATKSEPLPSLA